jgi:hypothetical protein
MLQNHQSGRNNKSSVRPRRCFKRLEKAQAGGEGRELVYRAIVERHFGKHTGLLPYAKACPGDHADMETGCEAGAGEGQA